MVLTLATLARRLAPAAALMMLGAAAPTRASAPMVELEASGVVRETRSEWRGRVIFTHVTLEVGICHSRTCPTYVEYEQMGGRMGNLEQQLGEESVPRAGEPVRVALRRNSRGVLIQSRLLSAKTR